MILTLHIFGALLTIAVVIASIFAMRLAANLERCLKLLGIFTVFQLLSGVALVLTDPNLSIARICLSSLIYLAIVGVVSLALRRQITLQRSGKLVRN
jgi:hypothetical protein